LLNLPYPILHDPDRATDCACSFERLLGIYHQSGTIVIGAHGGILLEEQVANPRKALPAARILRALDATSSSP
jgi:hypothetical protein